MSETGVPRDQRVVPNSAFERVNHFVVVAYQVLSTNPRLFLFLGFDAIVNLVILWAVLSDGAEDVGSEPAADTLGFPLVLTLSIVQSVVLHVLQCGLLVGALASLRAESVSFADALRVALSRLLPLAALAILMTILGLSTQFATAGFGVLSLPILLAWLGWFAVDLLAVALVADSGGSVMAYLAGAVRLVRRAWSDVLILLLLFLLTTVFLIPMLAGGIASGSAGDEPSDQSVLLVASASAVIRNIFLSFIYVYGTRLYVYAVTGR